MSNSLVLLLPLLRPLSSSSLSSSVLSVPHSRRLLTSSSSLTRSVLTPRSRSFHPRLHRRFYSATMSSDLHLELTAPNGTKYTQPLGLFINNEWVPSSDGKKISSINPT